MTSRIQLFKPWAYADSALAPRSITISNSVVTLLTSNGFTITNDPNSRVSVVLVQVQTDDIYVTFDGNTTPASGQIKLPSGYLDIWSVQMWNACKAIRVTTDATLVGVPGNY